MKGIISVREIGGELWAELEAEIKNPDSLISNLDFESVNFLIDFIMSVIARHVGSTVVNDLGIEVVPLPTRLDSV